MNRRRTRAPAASLLLVVGRGCAQAWIWPGWKLPSFCITWSPASGMDQSRPSIQPIQSPNKIPPIWNSFSFLMNSMEIEITLAVLCMHDWLIFPLIMFHRARLTVHPLLSPPHRRPSLLSSSLHRRTCPSLAWWIFACLATSANSGGATGVSPHRHPLP